MNVPHDDNLEFVWHSQSSDHGFLTITYEPDGGIIFFVWGDYADDATVTLSLEQVAELRKVLTE